MSKKLFLHCIVGLSALEKKVGVSIPTYYRYSHSGLVHWHQPRVTINNSQKNCSYFVERDKMKNVKRDLWLQDSTSKTVDPDRYILRTYDSVPQVRIHRPYRKEFGIHPELWTK